eukprot:Pgem_evm1s382
MKYFALSAVALSGVKALFPMQDDSEGNPQPINNEYVEQKFQNQKGIDSFTIPKAIELNLFSDNACTTAIPTKANQVYPVFTCYEITTQGAAPAKEWAMLDWLPNDWGFTLKHFLNEEDCLHYLNYKVYGVARPTGKGEVVEAKAPFVIPGLNITYSADNRVCTELDQANSLYYKIEIKEIGMDMWNTKLPDSIKVAVYENTDYTKNGAYLGTVTQDSMRLYEKPINCPLKYECPRCSCDTTTGVSSSTCNKVPDPFAYQPNATTINNIKFEGLSCANLTAEDKKSEKFTCTDSSCKVAQVSSAASSTSSSTSTGGTAPGPGGNGNALAVNTVLMT